MMKTNKEIEPPWIKYPEYPPGDAFWRQSGEPWLTLVWEAHWKTLSLVEQEEYLKRWSVPEVWTLFYFEKEFNEWLLSTDADSI